MSMSVQSEINSGTMVEIEFPIPQSFEINDQSILSQ